MTKATTGIRGLLLLVACASALALAAVALGRPEHRSEPAQGRPPAPKAQLVPEQELPSGGSASFLFAE